MKSIHDEKYAEIITRLRLARINRKITQQTLSKILNVPQSYISKVEGCERRLDVVELINWANALDLNLGEIIPTDIEKEKM